MIRLNCPGCERKLSIPDNLAGRAAACPQCKTKFRIPDPAAEQADEPPSPPPANPKRAAVSRKLMRDDDEPADEELDELEEVDDEPEEPARPPRRIDEEDYDEPRRPGLKRKRIRRSKGWSWLSGESRFNIAIIATFSVCFLIALVGVFIPPLLYIPVGVASVMLIVGHIVVLLKAFQDDTFSGCACMFIPFYSLFFVLTHLDEVRSALILYAASVILIIVSFCAAFAAGMLWGTVSRTFHRVELTRPVARRVIMA